jgi:hypothetical protein
VFVDPTTVSRDVSISTGNGIDEVWLEELTVVQPGKLSVSTGAGRDRIGILDSFVAGNVSIFSGDDNDQVGLLRVTTNGSLTVNGGNGDWQSEGLGDQIGLAGVIVAGNATLDGGDGGTRRTPGFSKIGVTGSTFDGNLTIKTGNGIDQIGVGVHDEIEEQLEDQLIHPKDEEIDIAGEVWWVNVPNGIVSINSGNYSQDVVAIGDLTTRVLRLTMIPWPSPATPIRFWTICRTRSLSTVAQDLWTPC